MSMSIWLKTELFYIVVLCLNSYLHFTNKCASREFWIYVHTCKYKWGNPPVIRYKNAPNSFKTKINLVLTSCSLPLSVTSMSVTFNSYAVNNQCLLLRMRFFSRLVGASDRRNKHCNCLGVQPSTLYCNIEKNTGWNNLRIGHKKQGSIGCIHWSSI